MRKFLVFEDGSEHELPPLAYDEFEKLGRWSGGPDIAYSEFCLHNKFTELDRFDQTTGNWRRAKIELREGEPTIDWSVTYGEL